MGRRKKAEPPSVPSTSAPESDPPLPPVEILPMVGLAASQFAEVSHTVILNEPTVAPRVVDRGVVVFDLDGTILDDIGLIGDVAGDVLFQAFGTPPHEGRIHYLATTGMPFEAQLAQLYPEAPAELRATTARIFHDRKVKEAYKDAGPFPEIPRLLKQLSRDGWTLVVSTGAEREMADLVLEREGLRYWFEAVLGSGQGTKTEHLIEYRRRYPSVPRFLVGDSRYDMEVAHAAEGVVAIGRASSLLGWTLSPDDLKRWGAAWADYSLSGLPEALANLESKAPRGAPVGSHPSKARPKRR